MKIYLLIISCWLLSCSEPNLKKKNILDKTLFENVLKEIQLAESTFKISKKKDKTSTEELLASTYSEIYKKNNISELDFFTSLNFLFCKSLSMNLSSSLCVT